VWRVDWTNPFAPFLQTHLNQIYNDSRVHQPKKISFYRDVAGGFRERVVITPTIAEVAVNIEKSCYGAWRVTNRFDISLEDLDPDLVEFWRGRYCFLCGYI
jgi:hypothetical protein